MQSAMSMARYASVVHVLVVLCLAIHGSATQSDSIGTVVIYVDSSSSSSLNDSSCWDGGDKRPCATIDLGMEGLWNMSQSTDDITVLSIATTGTHMLSSSAPTDFNRSGPLKIVGNGNAASSGAYVVIECERGVGLSFVYVRNVTLEGVAFYRCGAIRTSTSYNFNTSNPDYLLFHVGLYFLYCTDVTMRNITVAGTSGTAVVMYNTVGLNRIEHCNFLENIYSTTHSHPTGGSVYIEFSYCEPGSIECLSSKNNQAIVDQNYTHGAEYVFQSSHFYFNYADIKNFSENAFILPHRQYHSSFGRGGGISVFFKGNASDNSVTVKDCVFQGNRALWGGALFVEFQDWSQNNDYSVIGSTIQGNLLNYNDTSDEGTGGGGARVGFVFFKNLEAYGNNVVFKDCEFKQNNAYWGGGISLYAARQQGSLYPRNTFTVDNCNFTGNRGRLGAALDLSMWHSSLSGRHIEPQIINCSFKNNSVHNATNHGLHGIGAVYVDTLPVNFSGLSTFENNTGTALVIFSNVITVQSGGTLQFLRNSGRNGGAISLMGNGNILMEEDTHLVFINNFAQYQGGAIFAYRSGEHDLISSRNCFIRYYDVETHPGEWNASFYFKENMANKHRNSIYASTILPCVWGATYGSAQNSEMLKKNAFCWNNWTYYDNPNCFNEIASAPASFTSMHQEYTAIPGEILPLGIVAYDELGNNVTNTAIYLAQIKSGNASFHGSSSLNFDYISKNLLDLHGQPNSTVRLQIETIDPIVIQSEIEVSFQRCPPGFITSSHTDTNTTVCQCPQTGNSVAFAGYIRCYGEQFFSKILHHTWIGTVEFEGIPGLVVGRCPYVNSISNAEYISLPKNPDNLTEFFCSELNRKGVMCGSCIKDYGPSLTSNACVYCPEGTERYSWLLYILAVYLPMTVFFVCVFLFSMSAFGPLNAFIFFAQVITTISKVDAEGTVLFDNLANNNSISLGVMHSFRAFYTVLYDIWNLNFFLPLIPSFCLSSTISSATLQCLSYLSALYPLILLVCLSLTISLYNRGVQPCVLMFRPFHRCLARMRGWLKLRQPIAGGIAIFLVISYTKFTLVSFELLIPAPLYNASGTVVKQVLYIDGEIEYGSSQSALYISISTVLLIVFGFVPPIILVLPSLLHAVSKVCHHPIISKLHPSGKAQQFLDVFHGRYKDGTNSTIDCRWFAGLYFALRLVLFATYLADLTWLYQYTLQIIIYNVAAFLFAVVRPYKEDWINNVDTMIFLNLAIIVTLSNYNLSLARSGYDISLWAYTLQCILIMVPLIYCISYFVVLICHKRVKNCYNQKTSTFHQHCHHDRQRDVSSHVPAAVANFQPGITDSMGIENFLDFTHAAGRLNAPLGERLTNTSTWKQNGALNAAERAHLLEDNDDEESDSSSSS